MNNISIDSLSESEKESLRLIKKGFRQSMNADLSNSMRAHGFDYNIIFGVPAPRIKFIASGFEPNMNLAMYLWNENVRESKVISTYLFPLNELNIDIVRGLISEVKYTEIADFLSRNVLVNIDSVKDIIIENISSDNHLKRYIGMRLFTILLQRNEIEVIDFDLVLNEIKNNLLSNVSYLRSMSVNIADLLFERNDQLLDKAKQYFSTFKDEEILRSFNELLY